MRPSIILSALLGALFGGACGAVGGVMTATNFYEYHVLDTSAGDEIETLVNRDGWQPMAELKPPDRSIPFFYRRPRVRLP